MTWNAAIECRLIKVADSSYPQSLRHIHAPPARLFAVGGAAAWSAPCVAIVGSRSSSEYGRGVARELASQLAARGLCVVSGLARGIDTAAHEGALDAGGLTVAVLGCGLDIVYPPENDELLCRIAAGGGAVISDFPMGTPPRKWTFPQRNRIISGLSLGVILIEAPSRSGALITARHAVEQSREVFAVPGNVTSRLSEGCHALIKDGAVLVRSVEDVLEELKYRLPQEALTIPAPVESDVEFDVESDIDGRKGGGSPMAEGSEPVGSLRIGDGERSLLALIGSETAHLDELARASRMPAGQLLDALLRLELAGLVKQLPGKVFRRRTQLSSGGAI